MKITAFMTLGLATAQTTDPAKKFKHLNKVYPQMLDLFFKAPGAANEKVFLISGFSYSKIGNQNLK